MTFAYQKIFFLKFELQRIESRIGSKVVVRLHLIGNISVIACYYSKYSPQSYRSTYVYVTPRNRFIYFVTKFIPLFHLQACKEHLPGRFDAACLTCLQSKANIGK